jgi:hypothetical protein
MLEPIRNQKITLPPLITNIVGSHHHHHTHLHRNHHSKDKEAQTAHPNLQPHESGTKSEGVTPEQSRPGSRRNSLYGDMASWDWRERERRPVKDSEVKEEKERSLLRATELRNAITGLNDLPNNTTRRLDNTYYSVLEKLSALQSTIVSMKELAVLTRQLNEEFGTESEEVVRDVEGQLEGFEDFEEQRRRIQDLQTRVMDGRDKIKTLGTRVDIVKEKVEGWEKAEGEWQNRTRKRLRMLWIMIAVTGVAVLALMGMRYTPARNQAIEALKGVNASSLEEILPDLERIKNSTKSTGRTTMDAIERMLVKEGVEELQEDPRLRLLDEL